ncbi:MAG: Jag N-terminal domain-containing protein [Candidatus Krumholzibacteriia bacterium]
MTDKIEIKGKTVDDAVREALLRMGARKDEVTVKVIDEPKKGILGIGGRQAKVLVEMKSGGRRSRGRQDQGDLEQGAHSLGDGRSGDRGRRGGRSRDGGRDGGRDGARAGGRDGGRDGNRDGGRTGRRDGGRGAGREDARDGSGSGGRGGRRDEGRDENRRSRGPRDPGRGRSGRDRDDRPGAAGRSQAAEGASGAADNRAERRDAPDRAGDQDTSRDRGGSRRRGGRGRRGGRSRDAARVQDAANLTENQGSNAMSMENNQPEPRSAETTTPAAAEAVQAPEIRPAAEPRPAAEQTGPAAAAPAAPEARESMAPAAASAGDQVLAAGIRCLEYAKPLRDVTEEGLDAGLVSLTGGMLVRSGFPCRCEVHAGEYRQVRIVTDDSSAGILIGRRGATVDAVEHLVERMVSTAHGDRVKMNLDINNYRRRREDSLVDRVADAIDKVLETGEPIHMEPMNARERRIVHLEAAEAGLTTVTEIDAEGKHVVISKGDGAAPVRPADDDQDGED